MKSWREIVVLEIPGIKTWVINNSYISLKAFHFISTMIDLGNMKRISHLEAVTITEKQHIRIVFLHIWRVAIWKEVCIYSVCFLMSLSPLSHLHALGFFHIKAQCCLIPEAVLPGSNSTWIIKCRVRKSMCDLSEAQHWVHGRTNFHLLLRDGKCSQIIFKKKFPLHDYQIWTWDRPQNIPRARMKKSCMRVLVKHHKCK